MRILAKLKGKYCSWCEAENCKKIKQDVINIQKDY